MSAKGLNIIHTGEGKGKTTAALGLLVRAVGNGKKVIVYQFIKGKWKTGEAKALRAFKDLVEFIQLGEGFINTDNPEEKKRLKQKAEKDFEVVKTAVSNLSADMIILDEIIYMVKYGLIEEDKIIDLMKSKPERLHLVLTGRGATSRLIREADLVTEMKRIKHPYKQGIKAQAGIEF